jgi:hypothetical protein
MDAFRVSLVATVTDDHQLLQAVVGSVDAGEGSGSARG